MAGKKLTEMSNEELQKNENILKVIIYLSIFAAVAMFAVGLWLTIVKKKFSALTVVAFPVGINIIVSANNLKAIQRERKSRNI